MNIFKKNHSKIRLFKRGIFKITAVTLCCLSGVLPVSAAPSGASAAIAADVPPAVQAVSFPDIVDTPFYDAIIQLTSAGIIKGYPDGSFRPYGSLTRAEAAALIYRSYGSASLALYNNRYYSDVSPNMWAASYIDYCSATGIVNGYPDGTFHPDAQVTYNEIITMIVRTRGMDDGSLSWPSGFVEAARSDGMLSHLSGVILPDDGNVPSNRGNTSMLISTGSSYNTTAAAGPTRDLLTDPNMKGLCFGFVAASSSTTDRLGDACSTSRFLMGSTVYDVLSARSNPDLFANLNPVYGLMQLYIKDGRVMSARRITKAWKPASAIGLLTPASQDLSSTEFCRVTDTSRSSISYHAAARQSGVIPLTSETVCYELGISDGKVTAVQIPSSDIRKKDMTAVYSLNVKGNADIVLIVHPEHISEVLSESGTNDIRYLGAGLEYNG